MNEQRSLTVRIRVDGRTSDEERAILDSIRGLLAKVPGDVRPVIEYASAVREPVPIDSSMRGDQ